MPQDVGVRREARHMQLPVSGVRAMWESQAAAALLGLRQAKTQAAFIRLAKTPAAFIRIRAKTSEAASATR